MPGQSAVEHVLAPPPLRLDGPPPPAVRHRLGAARRRRCARAGGARAGAARSRSTPRPTSTARTNTGWSALATVAGSRAAPASPALSDAAEDRGADRVAERAEQQRRSTWRCRGRAGSTPFWAASSDGCMHEPGARAEQQRGQAAARTTDELRSSEASRTMATVMSTAAGDRPGPVAPVARDQPAGDEGAEGGAEHERHEHEPGPRGADVPAPPARTGGRRRSRTTAAGRW